MTTPEPIKASMRLMNDVIDQIEEILARRDLLLKEAVRSGDK